MSAFENAVQQMDELRKPTGLSSGQSTRKEARTRDFTGAQPQPSEIEWAGGMRLSAWCKRIGISAKTAARWRAAGKLDVVTRNGLQFITAETIRTFFTDDGSRCSRGIAAANAARRRRQERLETPPTPAAEPA